MQVRRGLIHVEKCPEYPQGRIPFLEALHILVQQFLCQCAVLGQDAHIIFVADLDDQLMERLFLLACPQMLVVVGNTAVFALLLGVVATYCIIEQFVVYLLNRLIPVHDILAAAFRVYILCGKTSPVMVEGAGTPHC